jgi:uncharacterized protein (TIGR02594 family)
MFCPSDFTPYPWMKFALGEYGICEVDGPGRNSNIVAYLATVGLGDANDETHWCSALVNWCMQQAGISGSSHCKARSWLTWSSMCLGTPRYGCVTILWRGSPTSK